MKKIAGILTFVFLMAGGYVQVKAENIYSVERIYGSTRYETSQNIADKFESGKMENIIITSGNTFPDALSGALLSKKLNAPILLKNQDSIEFIKDRMDVNGNVYILGGESVVEKSFETELNSLGYKNIIRLGGKDRFSTNEKILNYLNVKESTPVVVVNGFGFADALSVSSSASSKGYPIVLSNSHKMGDSLKRIIEKIKPERVIVVGGSASINTGVENDIKNMLSSLGIDSKIDRIGGSDRYETSLKLCKYFHLSSDTAVIASGKNFPDALSGSALAAKADSPVILTDGYNIENQKKYLDESNCKNVIILGGYEVIDKNIENILGVNVPLSDSETKKVLVDADNVFKSILNTKVRGDSSINVDGITYAPVDENWNNYDYIHERLENYYSSRYIDSFIKFIFKNIDGKFYMRYGNPGATIDVANSWISSKRYEGNNLYITLSGYYLGEQEKSSIDVSFIYDGGRWVVDKFNNLGIE